MKKMKLADFFFTNLIGACASSAHEREARASPPGYIREAETPDVALADRLSDDPIRNGIHAQQLLQDPLLKQILEDIRNQYLKRYDDIAAGDVAALQLNQLALTALKEIRQTLLTYRFNGQTATRHDPVGVRPTPSLYRKAEA